MTIKALLIIARKLETEIRYRRDYIVDEKIANDMKLQHWRDGHSTALGLNHDAEYLGFIIDHLKKIINYLEKLEVIE